MKRADLMPSDSVVVYDDSSFEYRVHHSTCADVAKELRNGFTDFGSPEGKTFQEFAEGEFGDIASDTNPVGSPEWENACYEWMGMYTMIMPCTRV